MNMSTQDEVNKAVEELNVAISKLTGVKPKEEKGEPEKVEAPKEYTGVQAGAIVEPEKVEPPKEYTRGSSRSSGRARKSRRS